MLCLPTRGRSCSGRTVKDSDDHVAGDLVGWSGVKLGSCNKVQIGRFVYPQGGLIQGDVADVLDALSSSNRHLAHPDIDLDQLDQSMIRIV
jgi:hypothetical protein